jgi:hypothetical protein
MKTETAKPVPADPSTSQLSKCGGFTVVEFAVISVLFSVGLMGFMGAMLSSFVVVKKTKARNRASATVESVVEQFRRSCTENFDLALTNSIGRTTYYRMRLGNYDVDIGDKAVGTAPVSTTKPPPTIPTSVNIDTVGVKTMLTDADGNSVVVTNYVATDTTKYQQTVVTYASGTVSTRQERWDPDSSTSTSATTKYSSGTTWSMMHTYDATTKASTYTSSDQALALTKPGFNVFGTTMIDSTGARVKVLDKDSLVDFDSLSNVGAGARLTVAVIADETTIDPPFDLNGDGDYLDSNLAAADLQAAILRVVITWNDRNTPRKVEFSTILARGEM